MNSSNGMKLKTVHLFFVLCRLKRSERRSTSAHPRRSIPLGLACSWLPFLAVCACSLSPSIHLPPCLPSVCACTLAPSACLCRDVENVMCLQAKVNTYILKTENNLAKLLYHPAQLTLDAEWYIALFSILPVCNIAVVHRIMESKIELWEAEICENKNNPVICRSPFRLVANLFFMWVQWRPNPAVPNIWFGDILLYERWPIQEKVTACILLLAHIWARKYIKLWGTYIRM